ncbi:hypothetical protein [Halosegnis longus]|uniref:hypothetical protein n=1 Tax=Halosegnis longus TaxID=2216012 RepID=UPI00129EEDC6|nr:hypothetical protein [Halosegnis longus]
MSLNFIDAIHDKLASIGFKEFTSSGEKQAYYEGYADALEWVLNTGLTSFSDPVMKFRHGDGGSGHSDVECPNCEDAYLSLPATWRGTEETVCDSCNTVFTLHFIEQ